MNVRIVCSGTESDFNFKKHQAFIYDQVEAIREAEKDISFHYFFIGRKGISGYYKELRRLKKEQLKFPCDLIHAHFGLSALLAVLQCKEPVVATFHGSDINNQITRLLSAFASFRAHASVFVSEKLRKRAIFSRRSYVIPCGINLSHFRPMDKLECRKELGLNPNKQYILFSSSFLNPVKNYKLLDDALRLWKGERPEVLELWNIEREQVPLWINAADACVLTSFMEGSPQFVKEAIACNSVIVATDVGDISERFGDATNLRIATFAPDNVLEMLSEVIRLKRANDRILVHELDNRVIANKIINIYKSVIKK
jgi:teichuronic acid biosynthesis glycosyltransferase TuaC